MAALVDGVSHRPARLLDAVKAEGSPDKTADDMDHREFSGETMRKYGYNPSIPY